MYYLILKERRYGMNFVKEEDMSLLDWALIIAVLILVVIAAIPALRNPGYPFVSYLPRGPT